MGHLDENGMEKIHGYNVTILVFKQTNKQNK